MPSLIQWTDEMRDILRDLHAAGATVKQIASRLGMGPDTVRNEAGRLGIERRRASPNGPRTDTYVYIDYEPIAPDADLLADALVKDLSWRFHEDANALYGEFAMHRAQNLGRRVAR